MPRKALSRALRFRIFKRDSFVCQYCGRTPPAVVLEVDHVQPVSGGGTDDDHNLLTSCFDCNRGKGAETLDSTLISVSDKLELLKEKREQAQAYNRLLKSESKRKQKHVHEIVLLYENAYEGFTLTDAAWSSIERFLDRLPFQIVLDAMRLATLRTPSDRAFKYFCGVCWRIIKDDRN